MSDRHLKIVWVSHFSDVKLRENLRFDPLYYRHLLHWFKKKPLLINHDYAPWIRNAISQFEKYGDIDLTIIHPHYGVSKRIQKFSSNGISYVCFRSEDDNVFSYVLRSLFKGYHSNYKKNSRIIIDTIKTIHPDIVHFIGAENPDYSLSALNVPPSIPCLVSLQTLMSAHGFCDNYPIDKKAYCFRAKSEIDVIRRCDYIASGTKAYQDGVKSLIKPKAPILNLSLALGVDINLSQNNKEYDFVYYAGHISKAADYAVEAFAIACKKHPHLKLNLSGAYTEEYKTNLDKRIKELGIDGNVVYTGSKSSHDEVILQIKKSRFALLPLKVDIISSTIREAMACGLPVVTTITPGTPLLNKDRESVLLSEKGDYQSMASNMLKLVDNDEFAKFLRDNAILTIQELYSNKAFMEKWRKAYYAISENFKHGKSIPEDLLA